MAKEKQFITHSVNLAENEKPFLDQFQINIFLYADPSRIATDIRTSFPYLMQEDRQKIDSLIEEAYFQYQSQTNNHSVIHHLSAIESFIQYFQPLLLDAYKYDSGVNIDSIALELYLETYQTESSFKNK